MQFWPRKRASRLTARVRTWATTKDAKPLGFAGYKAGMTHIVVTDSRPNSLTKGEDIPFPVTVIECPPLRVAAINLYAAAYGGTRLANVILAPSHEKYVNRAFPVPKKYDKTLDGTKVEHLADIRLLTVAQPHLIKFKKTPEVIELAIGGTLEQKLAYAKSVLGKDINVNDAFVEGNQVDVHSVTTGRGTQGPVARFGVDVRSHKSQGTTRGPGSLGPWRANRSWAVSHLGQTGLHMRTEINKWLLKIGTNPAEIALKGGFKRYGVITANYILLKGSIGGPSKRLITFTQPVRPNRRIPKQVPATTYVSLTSKQ
ncbi:50S ribosomal protein L3 [Candidatus Woesearchaeota archaeon]|nr:50S ribosomal protein L3 [Candidatus Woesearchaeota archaeon]